MRFGHITGVPTPYGQEAAVHTTIGSVLYVLIQLPTYPLSLLNNSAPDRPLSRIAPSVFIQPYATSLHSDNTIFLVAIIVNFVLRFTADDEP